MSDEAAFAAEQALIGSLLKQPSQLEAVNDVLHRDDFKSDAMRWTWDAMLALKEHGLGIDVITVGDELDRNLMLDDFGWAGKRGRVALAYIRDEGMPGNASTYAVNVLDYAAKRRMLARFSVWAEQALNGRHASELQKDIINGISDISVPNQVADTHTMTIGSAVGRAFDETSKSAEGTRKTVPTGFCDLDRLLNEGLSAPDVMIVAARPGVGKTSLLLNIAYNAAKERKNIAFFTLEMANIQLAMRLIAMESGITFGQQRSGKLVGDEWDTYTNAIQSIEHLPIYLCDLPAIKLRQMNRVMRTLEARHGKIDLVVLDYLQLADADGRYETRQLEVSRISAGLKAMAKDFDVPVLAAAQLSRAAEMRADRRPILSDLRESGSIENDSDIVSFIYRPNPTTDNHAELILAKHRNGMCGVVNLLFVPERTTFVSAEMRRVNLNEPDTRRMDIFGD